MATHVAYSVGMTQTTATALGNLRDSIRAELLADFIEKLEALREGSEVDHYRDGVDDAIAVLEGE
jgi:hypothetical protein